MYIVVYDTDITSMWQPLTSTNNKSGVYCSRIRFLTNLATTKCLNNGIKIFKSTLKEYLISHTPSTLQEFTFIVKIRIHVIIMMAF